MNLPPFATLAVAATVIAALIFLLLALRAGRPHLEPLISASFRQLREGWYQADFTFINRSSATLAAVELRRLRPSSARLMAPITSVSTREGDFQVWSDPHADRTSIAIPLQIIVPPREARGDGSALGSETKAAIWVFLPERANPAELVFELSMRDGRDKLRRYRVVARR
jgi:hypothetical protein